MWFILQATWISNNKKMKITYLCRFDFFSKTELIFVLRDKLSPGTKPGFLKSENMLRFILLYTHKVYQKCFRYTLCVYKSMNHNIFSDLRKPGLVPGESLSLSTNINSVLEKKSNLHYVKQNEKSSYAFNLFIF